jgi:DNA mismatch repair protein MSH5
VYGVFHHLAKTPQGKYLLRQYFLRPSFSLEIIDERLDAITAFLRPENADSMENLVKDLQSVRNMRTLLINLRKGVSSGSSNSGGFSKSVWAGIRQVCSPFIRRVVSDRSNYVYLQFAYHALQIRDALRDMNGSENVAIRNNVSHYFPRPFDYYLLFNFCDRLSRSSRVIISLKLGNALVI